MVAKLEQISAAVPKNESMVDFLFVSEISCGSQDVWSSLDSRKQRAESANS